MSSRLFQEAREKLGLAYNIDAWADVYADAGLMGIYAGCAAKDAARLAKVAAEQIRALQADFSDIELGRAKAQLKAFLFMGRESLLGRAEQAAAQMLAFGRLLPTAEIAAAIDVVSVDDVRRLAGRLVAPQRSATSVLGPKSAGAAAKAFTETVFS